jgi:hypothetical protein
MAGGHLATMAGGHLATMAMRNRDPSGIRNDAEGLCDIPTAIPNKHASGLRDDGRVFATIQRLFTI